MKSTTQVRAAHILLKHTGSRNPNDSYRNVTQFIQKKITRDAEEAEKMLTEIEKGLRNGDMKFDKVAGEVSSIE